MIIQYYYSRVEVCCSNCCCSYSFFFLMHTQMPTETNNRMPPMTSKMIMGGIGCLTGGLFG